MQEQKNKLPEIWGGIECTINRLNDRYLDQLHLAGLYDHPAYLDGATEMGLKKIRFPVLWEKHQPYASAKIDWSWTEARLEELRSKQIEPIAGLLHHGSGPPFTDLLQEDFPDLFAAYAFKVALKFPWIQYYTPVNEPLTTARFSGLYGLWYPHKQNDVSFFRMLLNELKGAVLAMQQIRKVNARAKFIQTEDLGKTYSTSLLKYQADFENHRRWLTYDLLCGRFTSKHPLWNYAIRLGIEKERLQFFIDNPCPPDIIGVNHYPTSERFLDEDIESYPAECAGGNSLHQYADVEAIRVEVNEPHGLKHLLLEMWERYKIPMAITEAHLHCTREEQLRWFHQVYTTVCGLIKEEVELVAVTCWALLGSFGWNRLLTDENCDYETGAFDISAGYARPTALALLLKNMGKQVPVYENLLALPGWWQQNARYFKKTKNIKLAAHPVQPVIIIGNTGTLGKAFSKICMERNIHHFLLGRDEADICNQNLLIAMVSKYRPWAIINTAGYVQVDEAENNKDACYNSNYSGAVTLAKICFDYNIKLLSYSSDLVFDGHKHQPYLENDLTNPLNTYGYSKQMAEEFSFKKNPNMLMIRTAAFFSPCDEYNFVHNMLRALQQGNKFDAPNDVIISPTYVPHLVQASLDLLIDNCSGIWHLTNKDCLSWYDFAKKIISLTDLDSKLLVPVYNLPVKAERPSFSALSSNKYNLMPSLDEALKAYFFSIAAGSKTLTEHRAIKKKHRI